MTAVASETFLDGRVTILIGDVLDALRALPDDHFDCVVTSPPYWGLRDYGVEGQIGLEPTLGEHIEKLVAVFREVRRVLKPTGTVWLNYGDCYATTPNGRSAADTKDAGRDDRTFRDKPFSTTGPIYGAKPGRPHEALNGTGRRGGGNAPAGPVYDPEGGGACGENKGNANGVSAGRVVAGGVLKPKDLCMLANRLAIALQDDGWWVRAEIVWGKLNPMPDSNGKYRPSPAHEKIFVLTKAADADVWRARDTGDVSFSPDLTERCPLATKPDEDGPRWERMGHYYNAEAVKVGRASAGGYKMPDNWDTGPGAHGRFHRQGRQKGEKQEARSAQARQGTKKAPRGSTPRHAGHIENTGLDDTPRGEGRYLRNYEPAPASVWPMASVPFPDAHFATFPPELVERALKAGCPAGGTVLDPFGGAGTTGLVAAISGRPVTLIELSADYAAMARKRLEAAFMGRDEARRFRAEAQPPDDLPIFQSVRQEARNGEAVTGTQNKREAAE